jgi:hypothetical protein
MAALLCAAVPARASAAAALPPDLVALEQQMAQLQANSVRFSFQEEFGVVGLSGEGAPLLFILAGGGEAGDSPPEGTVTGGLFGQPEEKTRTIGESVYTYRRQAGEIDGRRPWVRSQRPAKEEAAPGAGTGLDPGSLLENDHPGAQGTFSKLIAQLNGAMTIEESGPATVDGQRVIEFDATLDPAPLLAQLRAESKEPLHPLSSPFGTNHVGGSKTPAKPAPPPTLELEVFIAPSGLPVRVRLTLAAEGATIAIRVDTLAINIPVDVVPPPIQQTIDAAQLKRIERRRAARELKLALRTCGRLRGKSAASCRALVHIRTRVPSAEASPL